MVPHRLHILNHSATYYPFLESLLPDRLKAAFLVRERTHAHRNGLLPLLQSLPSRIRKLPNGYTYAPAILNVRLIMQLRLHRRRQDLYHLDVIGLPVAITSDLVQLGAHRHDDVMQSRLGGAVVRTMQDGEQREAGRREDEAGGGGLSLEEGEEVRD